MTTNVTTATCLALLIACSTHAQDVDTALLQKAARAVEEKESVLSFVEDTRRRIKETSDSASTYNNPEFSKSNICYGEISNDLRMLVFRTRLIRYDTPEDFWKFVDGYPHRAEEEARFILKTLDAVETSVRRARNKAGECRSLRPAQ